MTPAQEAIVAELKAQGWKFRGLTRFLFQGLCAEMWNEADECTKIITPSGRVSAWS